MKRFLQYHLYGTGIVKRGTSIPLATGSHSHEAIEYILKYVIENEEVPSEAVVRDAVDLAIDNYEKTISETDYEVEADNRVEHVYLEQATLVSGLVFAWASHILPGFLENFRVLAAEQEMEMILGCTCGLGPVGTVEDHAKNDCDGVVLMSRPDIVAKDYMTEDLVYVEIKTGALIDNRTFENDIQFPLAAAAIEYHYEREMSHYYIHGLIKGRRANAYNPETRDYTLPPQQQSPLCYGWYQPPVAGLTSEDIKFRKGKGVSPARYSKTPIWEMVMENKPEGISKSEHYVNMMDDEELGRHVGIFGPYDYPGQAVKETLEDITMVEKTNAEVFPYVNDLVEEHGLGHEDVQKALRAYVPRSWNCKNYNRLCEYHSLCIKRGNWDCPLEHTYADGKPVFEKRTPNHPIEGEFEV
jgi:hypothetical protein